MARQPLQDIVMPSQRKRSQEGAGQPSMRPPRRPGGYDRRPSGFSRFSIWGIVIVVLLILALLFSVFLSGATVRVTPQQEKIFVDGAFSASRGEGELTFEAMTVERVRGKTVSATQEEEVEERASGQIIIYNNYNEASQRLIKNTRFETPDGLIYRINDSVVVPGEHIVDDERVPGSIEVTVYADEPGEPYNIGLTDFTIPGFKGSPRFEGFYARSKTEMTGGFIGTRLAVPEETLEATKKEIETALQEELRSLARAERPEGFLLYDDGIFFTFESLPNIDGTNETEVRVKGTLYGILFEASKLAEEIARNTIADYDENPVTLERPDDIILSFTRTSGARLWEEDEITFDINGTANIVWLFDLEELQTVLAGKSKDVLSDTLSRYPGINEAEAVIRPFWQNSFPSDPEKITIERVLE